MLCILRLDPRTVVLDISNVSITIMKIRQVADDCNRRGTMLPTIRVLRHIETRIDAEISAFTGLFETVNRRPDSMTAEHLCISIATTASCIGICA